MENTRGRLSGPKALEHVSEDGFLLLVCHVKELVAFVSANLTSGLRGKTVAPLVLPNEVEAKDKGKADAERKTDEGGEEGRLVDGRFLGEKQLWCDDLPCT